MPTHEEVIQATRNWLEKAVIGLNLCPFAKAVYVKNQVRIVVSEAKHLDAFLEDLDREMLYLAEVDPEVTDTTLLIHPTLLADFLTFNDVVAIAEEAVDEHELTGILQVANFHPQFQFDGTELDDLGNFTNRSPYPTIHLIRESSIAKAAEAFPDASVIFERNIQVMNDLGLDACQALARGEDIPARS